MRCCTCESIRSVGCYPHCGTITLPLTALQTGEHQLVWLHAGIQRSLTLDLTGGQAIAFPNDDLFPESADVTFQIIQPDGNPLPASDGSLCFRLRTRVAV